MRVCVLADILTTGTAVDGGTPALHLPGLHLDPFDRSVQNIKCRTSDLQVWTEQSPLPICDISTPKVFVETKVQQSFLRTTAPDFEVTFSQWPVSATISNCSHELPRKRGLQHTCSTVLTASCAALALLALALQDLFY